MKNSSYSQFKLLLAILIAATVTIQVKAQTTKEIASPSNQITGKYTVPDCPEWVNHAVFYQIILKRITTRMTTALAIYPASSKSWITLKAWALMPSGSIHFLNRPFATPVTTFPTIAR